MAKRAVTILAVLGVCMVMSGRLFQRPLSDPANHPYRWCYHACAVNPGCSARYGYSMDIPQGIVLIFRVGIKIAAPELSTNVVVAIACLLIVVLFAIQPFGVSRLSNFFAPIVMVWLSFNMAFGVYVCIPIVLRTMRIVLMDKESDLLRPLRRCGIFSTIRA